MPRAAVTYKTKEEIARLTSREIHTYISWLSQRASYLRGEARKSIEKRIGVARKVRDLILGREAAGKS